MTFLLPIPILEPVFFFYTSSASEFRFQMPGGGRTLPSTGHLQIKLLKKSGAAVLDEEIVRDGVKVGSISGVIYIPLSAAKLQSSGFFRIQSPVSISLTKGDSWRCRFGSSNLPAATSNVSLAEWVLGEEVQGRFGEWSNSQRGVERESPQYTRVGEIDPVWEIRTTVPFDGRAFIEPAYLQGQEQRIPLFGNFLRIPWTRTLHTGGVMDIKGVDAQGQPVHLQPSISNPVADIKEGLTVASEEGGLTITAEVIEGRMVHLYRLFYPSSEAAPIARFKTGGSETSIKIVDPLAVLGQRPFYYLLISPSGEDERIEQIVTSFNPQLKIFSQEGWWKGWPEPPSLVEPGWLYLADKEMLVKLANPLLSTFQRPPRANTVQTLSGNYVQVLRGHETLSRTVQVEGDFSLEENLHLFNPTRRRQNKDAPLQIVVPNRVDWDIKEDSVQYPSRHRRTPAGPATQGPTYGDLTPPTTLSLYEGTSLGNELSAEGAVFNVVLDWLTKPGYKVVRTLEHGSFIGVLSAVTLSFPRSGARTAHFSATLTETHPESRPPAELFVPRLNVGSI